MWWLLFLVLVIADRLAMLRFVPIEHRERYRLSRWTIGVWVALGCRLSIPALAAIGQWTSDWPPFPSGMRLVGIALFVAGSALSNWAFAVNPYYLPIVARPGKVIRNGPYRWLHHPGYVAYIVLGFGSFLLLGQDLAIIPTGLYAGIMLARMIIEDRLLRTHNAA